MNHRYKAHASRKLTIINASVSLVWYHMWRITHNQWLRHAGPFLLLSSNSTHFLIFFFGGVLLKTRRDFQDLRFEFDIDFWGVVIFSRFDRVDGDDGGDIGHWTPCISSWFIATMPPNPQVSSFWDPLIKSFTTYSCFFVSFSSFNTCFWSSLFCLDSNNNDRNSLLLFSSSHNLFFNKWLCWSSCLTQCIWDRNDFFTCSIDFTARETSFDTWT